MLGELLTSDLFVNGLAIPDDWKVSQSDESNTFQEQNTHLDLNPPDGMVESISRFGSSGD